MKIESCALMGCEIDGNKIESLGEILYAEDEAIEVIHQAQFHIKYGGFKETDKICEDCFWK